MLHPSCSASLELPPLSLNDFACIGVSGKLLVNWNPLPPRGHSSKQANFSLSPASRVRYCKSRQAIKRRHEQQQFCWINRETKAPENIKIIPLHHSYKHLLSTLRRPKTKLEDCIAKLKPPRNHVMRTAETFKTG